MLSRLYINNIVLIEKLALDFKGGMSALTGETGAGKSIILDSLSLILGVRSDFDMIRKGENEAQVTAEFDLPLTHSIWSLLPDEDKSEALIVSRMINRDGKSRAMINDRPVTAQKLKDIAPYLVDIHGQFETHALLDIAKHRFFLDQALEQKSILNDVSQSWAVWQDAKEKRIKLEQAYEESLKQKDQWIEDLSVLDDLDPQIGEEDDLLEKRNIASQSSRLRSNMEEAMDALQGQYNEAADKALNKAWKALSRVGNIDAVAKLQDRVDGLITNVRDIADGLYVEINHLNDMPDIEAVDDRLHELREVARRLNCTCEALPQLHQDIKENLSQFSMSGEALEKARHDETEARGKYITHAQQLTKVRIKTAKTLEMKIMAELPPLKLERAQYVVEVSPLEENQWGGHGQDHVIFKVAMNVGQDFAPLHKSASGGELSRLLLAMKMVLAGDASLLVFDEIDQGVGGATASAIGERIKRLANDYQVIVVTHSAQVAASASTHFIVQKSTEQGQTRATITELSNIELRRDEVARMLAGASVTSEAQAAALKLLEQAG